jgi:hypothetical protein
MVSNWQRRGGVAGSCWTLCNIDEKKLRGKSNSPFLDANFDFLAEAVRK